MATLRDRILDTAREAPGLTDRELADRLLGESAVQQGVNQAARALSAAGMIDRVVRPDSKIGNFAAGDCSAFRHSKAGPGIVDAPRDVRGRR